jgi:putative hydrolase of the HAD superfamily
VGSYRGLILDFAGVLTEGTGESQRSWCVASGLAPDAWERALGAHPEGRRWYADLEAGRIDQREWNRRTACLLGVEHDDLMGRAWAAVRTATEVVRLAGAARSAGITLALLSNSFGTDPYNPYAEVWDLFDVRVISEREGIAKPDPAIYRRTLDRMGLPGEECVFVDDQAVNLAPAAALGITTVHAVSPAAVVARVTDLLGLSPAAS